MASRIAAIDHVPVEPEKRRAFRGDDMRAAWDRQMGVCAMCGQMTKRAAADHILPLELGGKTELANLQMLCETPCHAIKTAQDIKRIAKARRLRAKNADPETRALAKPTCKRKIANRGFAKRIKP